MMKKELRNNAGITLIALVITVIVLLILAGVTIGLLTGENGILNTAKNAADKYNNSALNEQEKLNELLNELENEESREPELGEIGVVEVVGTDSNKFIFELETSFENEVYSINMPHGDSDNAEYLYDINIEWGDGITEHFISNDGKSMYKEFQTPGKYRIKIEGIAQGGISFQLDSRVKNIGNGFPKSMGITRKNFSSMFTGCTNLESIPQNLFANIPEATNFSSVFSSVYNLEKIPEKLFINNTKVEDFSSLFSGNIKITVIPNNLFGYNENTINVSSMFSGCNNLKTVRGDLLGNMPNLVDVSNLFAYCTAIESIPEGLFDNNIKIEFVSGVFSNCINVEGNAPELWLKPTIIEGYQAFENCIKLNNYLEIPSDWK